MKNSRRIIQLSLIVADAFFISVSFFILHSIRFHEFFLKFLRTPTFLIIVTTVIITNYVFSLYETHPWRSKVSSAGRILVASIVSSLAIFAGIYLVVPQSRGGLIGRGIFVGAILIYSALSFLSRTLIHKILVETSTRAKWLLIASRERASLFMREIAKSGFMGRMEVIEPHELSSEKLKQNWTALIVSDNLPQSATALLMESRIQGQEIMALDHFCELFWSKIPVFAIDSNWFVFSQGFSMFGKPVHLKIKRLTDLLIAFPLLLIGLPVMLLSSLAVMLESRGPLIYKQQRVGQNGRLFTIWKFRSMRADAETNGAQWAQANDTRITKVGKFLRLTRIDEMPQLVNILRGEMSFIGPRPERPEFTEELKKQIPFYDLRHLIKPGLTGWAQVMYPYGASQEDALQKFQYELFYLKNYSLGLDLKIVLRTIAVVLFGKGR